MAPRPESDTQKSTAWPATMPSKPRGPTPTIVTGAPESLTTWPTSEGSAPNAAVQKRWLTTAVAGAPVTSSPGPKARPRCGATPTRGK